MSKAREIPWPEEFSALKRIEELMICGICYEYIDTTVMTPCSHNYCSLCIRKYLHYKTQCPACFHNVFEKDLYINRSMDSLIEHYFNVREKLITLIENRVVYNKVVQYEPELAQAVPVRPVRSSQPRSPQISEANKNDSKLCQLAKSPKRSEVKQIEPKTPVMNSPLASTSKCNPCSPITMTPKIIPSIAKIFNTPKRKDPVPTQPPANTKTVSCPVCKVDISELHINVHLDACLKRETSEKSVKDKVDAHQRPPLPKLVLRVMKDAELRKKMKELGLPTQGDRRTLENRFTRYSTIYNSECDKVEPRPVSELIRQCEMEEKQERKMDMFLVSSSAVPTVRLQIERNAKEEKIEEAQKNYRVANKSSFDKLIEEVRNRRKMEKAKQQNCEATVSTNKEGDESTSLNIKQEDEIEISSSKDMSDNSLISKPTTSVKVEKVSESLFENEENNVYNPSAEIAFQDSDSDESCPLQLYRSDGSMKHVSMNLNDSSPCTSTSSSPMKRLQRTKIENSNDIKTAESSVSSVPNNIPNNNPYEVPTDRSSDDDIPRSPVINNKSTNRKRAKLSNTTLNKSNFLEEDTRQVQARDLCNSIIKDFAFDDSDDSLSEFAIKYKNQDVKKAEAEKINKSLNEANVSKNVTPQKKISPSCDKKVPETNSIDDFAHDILNGEDSTEFVDTGIAASNEARKRKSRETQNSSPQSNSIKVEKENNATSANEYSPPPITESTACRPIRKRNRPSRFANSQTVKKGDGEKTPKKLAEDSQDSESPEHFKSSTSDGSLKRRRGRTRANNKEQTSDQTQNPPKRPVRRRQAAAERN